MFSGHRHRKGVGVKYCHCRQQSVACRLIGRHFVIILKQQMRLYLNMNKRSTKRIAVYLEIHCNIGSKRAFPTGVLDLLIYLRTAHYGKIFKILFRKFQGLTDQLLKQHFENFYHNGPFCQKNAKNCSQNFQFQFQAGITPQGLQIAGNSLPMMSLRVNTARNMIEAPKIFNGSNDLTTPLSETACRLLAVSVICTFNKYIKLGVFVITNYEDA